MCKAEINKFWLQNQSVFVNSQIYILGQLEVWFIFLRGLSPIFLIFRKSSLINPIGWYFSEFAKFCLISLFRDCLTWLLMYVCHGPRFKEDSEIDPSWFAFKQMIFDMIMILTLCFFIFVLLCPIPIISKNWRTETYP